MVVLNKHSVLLIEERSKTCEGFPPPPNIIIQFASKYARRSLTVMPKTKNMRKYSRRYSPYQRKNVRGRKFPPSKTEALATRQKISVPRGVFGFPDEFITAVRYCESYTLTSTSGSIAKQYMRMNSIQDPDQTGTGHQPYLSDQITAVYNRYVVLKSKMTARFSCIENAITTTNPSGPFVVGVLTDDTASTSATLSTVLEQNTSIWRHLGGQYSGDKVTLYSTYNPERDLGLSCDDDTVGAAVGSNPTLQWYGLAFAAEEGLASPSSVNCIIEVVYTVKFSQTKDVAGS